MEYSSDPTGFIAHCVSELIQVGFDASAITLAKWSGVALLVAMFIGVSLTFFMRLRRGEETKPFFSDSQFKLILVAGLVLITFPMLTKFAGKGFNVALGSADREFAQRICQDSLDVTASDAQTQALMVRVGVLEGSLLDMKANLSQVDQAGVGLDQTGVGQESVEVLIEGKPDLIGQAISIFYRSERANDAVRVGEILRGAGAGVALRESDLNQGALSATAVSGAGHILFSEVSSAQVQMTKELLSSLKIPVTATHGPITLNGSPIQLLLF